MPTLSYSEKGNGPAMLMVHGWGGERGLWRREMDYWSGRYKVIAPDLPGHGKSPRPDGPPSYDTMADAMAGFCAEMDIGHPIIMGHSMGGVVSVFLANRPKIDPKAVIIIDSSIPPREGAVEGWRKMAAAMRDPSKWRDSAASFVREQLFLPTDPTALKEAVATGLVRNNPDLLADLMSSFAATDTVPMLLGCKAPILYVGSTRPRGDVEKLKALRPDAHIGIVVGSGHFINLVVPAQLHAMVDRFLEIIK